MKLLLIFVSALVLCEAQLDPDLVMKFIRKVTKAVEECKPLTDVTQVDIDTLRQGKIPQSHEGKCMIYCFNMQFNIQNKDGSLNAEQAVALAQPIKEFNRDIYDRVIKVIKTCGNTAERDTDSCIYAANLAACAIKQGRAMGLTEAFSKY